MKPYQLFISIFLILVIVGCQSRLPSETPELPVTATLTPTAHPTIALTAPPVSSSPAAPPLPTQAAPPTQAEAPALVEPTLSPTSLPSPAPTTAPTASPAPVLKTCQDLAVFIADITIPDGTFLSSGEVFLKTWRFQNSGECTWDDQYRLVFADGSILNGSLEGYPLPVTQPGETINLTIELTAPPQGGTYISYWELQDMMGERFGFSQSRKDLIWAEIRVGFPTTDEDLPNEATPAAGSLPANTCSMTQNPSYETQVLGLINEQRANYGLQPLTFQPQLAAAALVHSQDMACNNFIDHIGSDGSNWNNRVAAQGYANSSSAHENIYVGDPAFGGTPAGAVTWWMNSQVHRDNILNPYQSEIGIGYVYYAKALYGGYYTTVFARP